MARYVANTEQILALVDKARRIGRQFEQRIAEVEHEIAALHVDWQGDAADAHRSNAATWHREMTDMQTALAALETAAHGAHDGYIANVEHNMGMWP
ncbi:WXG100 family type VII secretion target [Prescottella agglutinans]|uniref:WXG100 family type VII secretion target n=1 Tax=Prescottella agglutinans TaxID=1644129 RepID=A0ABT6M784_9NOCA|nr:WXG100 family type VII secretion target [Prescottella agglutinans]MDH6279279.1 WXG100 family type VII secretion target [Prescottella agglutinans]